MTSPVKKTVKAKVVAVHPKHNEMVVAAITSLKESSGSSRSAILKYIAANYKVGNDNKKINVHLKILLRNGVSNGLLKQVKGIGSSGSFKVAVIPKPVKAIKKTVVKKAVTKKTVVNKAVTKTISDKKIVKKTTKKPVVKKTTSAVKPTKSSPKNVKKTVNKKPNVVKKVIKA